LRLVTRVLGLPHFGSKTQEAIQGLGTIEAPFKIDIDPATSVKEAVSRFNNQMKIEDRYAKSVYKILNTMSSEVAGEFTTTSK
jgi:hypothetical protein